MVDVKSDLGFLFLPYAQNGEAQAVPQLDEIHPKGE